MKKLSIILSLSFAFVGFAIAKPIAKQQKAATEKKEKKADKKEVKKVPARKTQDKKTPKK